MEGEVRIQGPRAGAGGGSVGAGEFSIFWEGKEKSFPKCIPCCIKIKQNPYMLKHPRIPPIHYIKISVSHRLARAQPFPRREQWSHSEQAGLHLIPPDNFILSVTGCHVLCEALFPNVVQGPQGHLVLGSAVKGL